MYKYIIENYINNLTKNDIIVFATNNNIYLNNNELDYVFHTIKTNYEILISDNYNKILLNAKKYLSENNYKKICNLFLDYRNKYKNFLN